MVIRILHHWACSGGTIISRSIASLPEIVLLSEVHPLAHLRLDTAKSDYAPTDLIQQLSLPHNGRDPVLCQAAWNGAIDALEEELLRDHKRLVLRSHSHIDFFTGASCAEEPFVRRCLAPRHRLLEILSVRHPLDSWISIKAQDWDQHFRFSSLSEFCRRALKMLEACSSLPILRYEDFTLAPISAMQQLINILDLSSKPINASSNPSLKSLALSGDSGRRGDQITPRPRRPIPQHLLEELESQLSTSSVASSYQQLCANLGYNTEPDASHPFTLPGATPANVLLPLKP